MRNILVTLFIFMGFGLGGFRGFYAPLPLMPAPVFVQQIPAGEVVIYEEWVEVPTADPVVRNQQAPKAEEQPQNVCPNGRCRVRVNLLKSR